MSAKGGGVAARPDGGSVGGRTYRTHRSRGSGTDRGDHTRHTPVRVSGDERLNREDRELRIPARLSRSELPRRANDTGVSKLGVWERIGKTVRIRRGPAAVTGDERRSRNHCPRFHDTVDFSKRSSTCGWEGAVSRTIRKPEDLPGVSQYWTVLSWKEDGIRGLAPRVRAFHTGRLPSPDRFRLLSRLLATARAVRDGRPCS
jgi:hypothetical protein